MSLRWSADRFERVSELDKELERTEILREQLLRKKELALRKEKHLEEEDDFGFESEIKKKEYL